MKSINDLSPAAVVAVWTFDILSITFIPFVGLIAIVVSWINFRDDLEETPPDPP
jgi:hypothetical protein